YRISRIALKDGRVLTGKVKDLSGNTLVLMSDPLNPADLLMVARDEIEETSWSDTSMMPEGLLDSFMERDIRDLVAFLQSPMANGEPASIAPDASSVKMKSKAAGTPGR